MKCFIHFDKEAIAVCKTCGKAMCANCSSYSGHSGVCPECRKKEFEQKVASLYAENKDLKWSIAKCALIFFLVVPIFFIIKHVNEINSNKAKIARLNGEINKLNTALRRGNSSI